MAIFILGILARYNTNIVNVKMQCNKIINEIIRVMINKTAIISTIFLMLFSIAHSQHTFKNGSKWIPENFNPAIVTLLIQQIEPDEKKADTRNDEMLKYLDKKYIYQYALSSKEDIINLKGKYADIKKYPFALMNKHFYESHRTYGTISVYDFYFLDRTTNIEYPLTQKTSSNPVDLFKPVINTILEKYKSN